MFNTTYSWLRNLKLLGDACLIGLQGPLDAIDITAINFTDSTFLFNVTYGSMYTNYGCVLGHYNRDKLFT